MNTAMTDIERLIRELTAADPSLQGREDALRPLLHELLAGQPEAAMDPAFRERLKRQLAAQAALARPRSAGWRLYRAYYGLGAVALLVLVVIAARPDAGQRRVAFTGERDAAVPMAAAPAPAAEVAVGGAGGGADDTMMLAARKAAPSDMQLTSDALTEGEEIPVQYTCDGDSAMPPLSWTGVPQDAVSLALIVHDPDAPREGGFTHWVVYDIPANAPGAEGTDGANGTGKTGYVGPCPPSGAHRYVFTLYALDAMLNLKPGADRDAFLAAADGHILATAELTGVYSRK